ncbi:MAG: hypothetical protein AMXMBFR33_16520 [Candidatus Xenobia bacterium]
MTQVMLDLPLDPRAPWLCFLSMLFVYTFAKTVRFDPTADALNDPERTAFLLRWRAPLIAAGVLGFGLGAWHAYRWQVLFLYLFPVLTAVLYDVKLLPAGYHYRRLKDITGVKSVVVAVAWSVLVILYPWAAASLTRSVRNCENAENVLVCVTCQFRRPRRQGRPSRAVLDAGAAAARHHSTHHSRSSVAVRNFQNFCTELT